MGVLSFEDSTSKYDIAVYVHAGNPQAAAGLARTVARVGGQDACAYDYMTARLDLFDHKGRSRKIKAYHVALAQRTIARKEGQPGKWSRCSGTAVPTGEALGMQADTTQKRCAGRRSELPKRVSSDGALLWLSKMHSRLS